MFQMNLKCKGPFNFIIQFMSWFSHQGSDQSPGKEHFGLLWTPTGQSEDIQMSFINYLLCINNSNLMRSTQKIGLKQINKNNRQQIDDNCEIDAPRNKNNYFIDLKQIELANWGLITTSTSQEQT